jgi:ribosomal protein L15E
MSIINIAGLSDHKSLARGLHPAGKTFRNLVKKTRGLLERHSANTKSQK